MAMNKSERAAMEALQTQLAFRWPIAPEPARLMKPPLDGGYAYGWDFNLHTRDVEQWWTGPSTHGTFHNEKRSGGRRGSRWLYETKADALLALRWAMCMHFAELLRIADLKLEAAA